LVTILDGYGYRVVVEPQHGATILSATWTRPDGQVIALLEPLESAQAGFASGCFVMAPFVNRIADGRFAFQGREYRMPLNRPAQGMAIHGFSRDHAWRVLLAERDHALFQDEVSSPDHPWCYTVTMDVSLDENGVQIALTLRNDGAEPLPFGMGLHPFIPCGPDTTIAFSASGLFASDSRGLPVAPQVAVDALACGAPVSVQAWRGTDRCYVDWAGQRARSTVRPTVKIEWPQQNCAMTLTADGAFRHGHLFLPEGRDVLCVEPVSHLPDAINRPALGADAAMTVLKPAESLWASLRLAAEALEGKFAIGPCVL
jgi:aldose 1-epimerase